MPVFDRREPGVYVDIEDASYVGETPLVGRSVFTVGICGKGQHNKLVKLTSYSKWIDKFGKPNFNTTTQSHYIMDAAMSSGATGYYIRIVPLDSKIANVSINEDIQNTEVIGEFIFTRRPENEVEKPFPEDYPNGLIDADYILAKDAYNAYVTDLNNSKIVTTTDETAFNNIEVGDWIFAGEKIASSLVQDEVSRPDTDEDIKQIVSKSWDSDNSIGYIYLNDGYYGLPILIDDGTTQTELEWTNKTVTSIFKHSRVNITNDDVNFTWDITSDNLDLTSTNSIYTFWATGAGEYYNGLKLKGTRNAELERMYVDDEGSPLFKYMFMDIALYKEENDGKTTRLEGPWTVALANRTSDGITIRDLSNGQLLYIEDVINRESELIKCKSGPKAIDLVKPNGLIDEEIAEKNRLNVMLAFAANNLIGTSMIPDESNEIVFQNGFDGHADYVEGGPAPSIPLYKYGKIQMTPQLEGLIERAFRGDLESTDNSIQQLKEVIYPWYNPDYIVTGGFSANIQNGGRSLADFRQDCIHLGDTGYRTSYDSDLKARRNFYDWNNWTSALYVQYREIDDPYTGEKMTISPCYHSIQRHLMVDGQYFIAEPVAGIEKGAIPDPMKLVYRPNHTERGDLIEAELNPTIYEKDGKYFLTQLTTYKRLSILKRLHAAKFVAFVRKTIPPMLKDILQRKATPFWINQAHVRVNNFLKKYRDATSEIYTVLESFSVNVDFDDVNSELNVYIKMKPLRVIERINVFIIVQ
jgi:hypothetical protein